MEEIKNNKAVNVSADRGGRAGVVWTVVAVLIVAGVVWYAVKNGGQINLPETQGDPAQENVLEGDPMLEAIMNAEDGTLPPGIVREFTIIGANYQFAPNEMRARKGETIRVIFRSDDMMHDWRVDELGLATKILPSGQQETLEFVADKAGEFEYYCSVGDHQAKGMVGKLIIEE